MLMHGGSMVQVYWYRFTMVYLTMIVWQWFHHCTSTSWRLDEARTCGCRHLPVVAREHRGLEPPSSGSWKTKEFGASNECNSSRHKKKNSLVCSHFGFPHKNTGVLCMCMIFHLFIVYLLCKYWMIMLHWYNTCIIWTKRIRFLYYRFTPPLSNPTVKCISLQV